MKLFNSVWLLYWTAICYELSFVWKIRRRLFKKSQKNFQWWMVWWLSNNVTQNIWFEIKALLSPSRGKHGNFIHFLYLKIEQFNGMYLSSTLHISLMFKLNSIEQKFSTLQLISYQGHTIFPYSMLKHVMHYMNDELKTVEYSILCTLLHTTLPLFIAIFELMGMWAFCTLFNFYGSRRCFPPRTE